MDCEELEIVQYKFASIIGGLCGKPKILSQFAVWLDLRLAEYKLKGAISLDCSGSTPDPDWLQGIKPDLSQQTQTFLSEHVSAEQTNESVLYGDAVHHIPSEQSGHVQSDQIKAEPYSEESVFPVGQYENVGITCTGTNNSQSTPVKYKARSEQFGPSSSKLRKVVQSTAANEDFSNVGTTPGLSSEPEEVTIDDDSESYESFTAGISSDFSQAPSTSDPSRGFSEHFGEVGPPSVSQMTSHDLTRHPAGTIRNTVSSIGVLTRWLREQNLITSDRIEELPVETLDMCLFKFFSTSKKKDGGEYLPKSLRALKDGIERYLKCHNYPYSIMKSPELSNSYRAFSLRVNRLKHSQSTKSSCIPKNK